MESLYYKGFEIYKRIYDVLAGEKKSLVFGISDPQKSHLAAATRGNLLYLASTKETALAVTAEISSYGTTAVYLPPRGDVLLGRRADALSYARIAALTKLLSGEVKVLVTTVEAVFSYLPRPEDVKAATITLRLRESLSFSDLLPKLIYAGYERVDSAPKKGEFRLVGDILYIFPVSSEDPVKVEFLYDEIESIKTYAPDFLSVKGSAESLTISPAGEILLTKEDVRLITKRIEEARGLQNRAAKLRTDDVLSALYLRAAANPSDGGLTYFLPFMKEKRATIFDYLEGFSVAVDEPKKVFEGFSSFLVSHYGRVERLAKDGEVLPAHRDAVVGERVIMTALSAMPQLGLSSFVEKISEREGAFTLNSAALPNYLKNSNMLLGFLADELKQGRKITIFAEDKEHAESLEKLLGELSSAVTVIPRPLRRGFVSKSEGVTLIGSGDILSKASAIRLPTRAVIAPKVGDYIVHEDFGIGRCLGLIHIKNYAGEGDYLAIQYADQNKIYLPVAQMDMLSVYSGSEEEPPLSNPNKGDFEKEKAKAKKSIKKMALDLVELYAKREKTKGVKYPPDNDLMRQFEAAFPYEETAGQAAAIADVKADMESGKVMDRLLCGDVGFGKTEVALRAIFKTLLAGKQVAFLAPTTILAEQHYETVAERLRPFKIKCACLTRFCTPKETKEILTGLKNGSLGVVVGTHRMLSKDVEFYDIGLLVLDEEQRFGVEHKEKIKSLRTSINVLSMSATPIPRTLHMSLSGIRDISLIDTPPKNRKPVRTMVAEYSPAMLKEAVTAELERGGQVFILYNNVARLSAFADGVRELVPQAEIVTGHGRMAATELEENIRKFYKKQADVLICTTIIENGIDIPDANTLIVVEANRLGLSQMYQLKGRVGRSERLAYAYFTFPEGLLLTGDAEKRLKALLENDDLGSGYRLAMMDLEIRGAGNVLGAEQHGHIERVGYDMYCTLLREAIAELNGEALPETGNVELSVKADAYLPKDYIESELQRLRFYKKIAAISDEKSKNAVLREMEENFGMPPVKAHSLVLIAYMKSVAASLFIKKISVTLGEVRVTYADETYPVSANVRNALHFMKDEIKTVDVMGAEVTYNVKAGSVMGKVNLLTKFLLAVRGDSLTETNK